MTTSILVIDDEKLIRLTLVEGLMDLGYYVEAVSSGKEAIEKLRTFEPKVILLDMKLKSESGLEIAKQIKSMYEHIEIIIITAYGDIETAIKAIKAGAIDYIKKPLDIDEIQVAITKALENQRMKNKIMFYEKKIEKEYETIIGEHPKMKEIKEKIDILSSNHEVTVLITGETGTGKEVVANSLHNKSKRKDKGMLSINCAAIPKELLESELFGFEKNAFSGANTGKKGIVELADGGTLFLDELGEIPLEMQVKLLRFLETRKFKRIGGLKTIEVDIRIVAATNKDLKAAVKKGEFREDLYYRLNVVPINIPPLRERGEDIESFANYFLASSCEKFKKNFQGFTKEAMRKIVSYPWPGNVREIKNIIDRMVIIYDGEFIETKHLPGEIQNQGREEKELKEQTISEHEFCWNSFLLEEKVKEVESFFIKKAMKESKGNNSHAAKLLGISRHVLGRKIYKYNINL